MKILNKRMNLVVFIIIFILSTKVLSWTRIEFDELTPVPVDVVDYAAKEILDLGLEIEIMTMIEAYPWRPESEEIKDIIRIPFYTLDDKVYMYLYLGYIGTDEMPSLENLLSDFKAYWEKKKKLLFDENVNMLEMIDWPSHEIMNDLHKERINNFEDKFVYTTIKPFMEYSSDGPVNRGISNWLEYFWMIYDKLEVLYPGKDIEFVCFRWIRFDYYHEFNISGERIFVKVVDKELNIEISTMDNFKGIEDTVNINPVYRDRYKELWDMFMNKNTDAIEDYKQDVIGTLGTLGNDLEGEVPDFRAVCSL